MRFVMFYHSLMSDWNHGNAHFLRGVVRELQLRGHDVTVYEPADAWSVRNLIENEGTSALAGFRTCYPDLESSTYQLATLELDEALAGADVVIVHEWNEPGLVARIGQARRSHSFRLLFHDTHHRAVSRPGDISQFDLRDYDGVLAFGEVIRRLYIDNSWAQRAWTWHEAADTSVFRPIPSLEKEGDLVWVGNWGDNERTAEIQQFLIEPAAALRLRARVYGVRYPQHAISALHAAGIAYGGWTPNYHVPRVFSRHDITVHIPRRPYVEALPGIPTIRVFEALACGIPLISAPWHDAEGLFTPGEDFLVAADGAAMTRLLRTVLADRDLASGLAARGLKVIHERHTCAHRVAELLGICAELGAGKREAVPVWQD